MTWVRLDDQFPDHPKIAGLSNDAFCLHVTAMCWTAKQQTDGKLPSSLLKRLAWRCQDPAIAVAELVNAKVWDVDPADGWQIHDFGEYNPTSGQAGQLAAKRSAAGTAGAMARWQNHGKTDGKQHGKPYGKIMPPSPSPSPSERDEGLARPPASKPAPAFPEQDPEWGAAISKLEAIGPMTGNILLELLALWPDLGNGKRVWVDDAITVAQANGASSPAYAVRVLTNSVRSGKRPGEVIAPAPRNQGRNQDRDLAALVGLK